MGKRLSGNYGIYDRWVRKLNLIIGLVAINPKFDKLITSLRTAVEKGDGTLE